MAFDLGNTASSIVQFIIQQAQKAISQKELFHKLPLFSFEAVMNAILAPVEAMVVDPPMHTQLGMRQQLLHEVRRLEKDNLMPKEVEREEIENVHPQPPSEKVSKKRSFMGTRNSFNQRNTLSLHNASQKFSKASQFSVKKVKKQSLCVSIAQEEVQDPEIMKYRRNKEIIFNQHEKIRKQSDSKRKAFLEKQANYEKEKSTKDVTFDFEGGSIGMERNDQRINHYSLKMRLSLMDKKLRSGMNFNNAQDLTQTIRTRNSVQLEPQQNSIQLSDIPVFTASMADPNLVLGIPTDRTRCKLQQYQKHYSGRYARLDKSLKTIDVMTGDNDRSDKISQIFASQRYIRDDDSLQQSMSVQRGKIEHGTRRKLALPKINGKYSTLDRYEHI